MGTENEGSTLAEYQAGETHIAYAATAWWLWVKYKINQTKLSNLCY
jgi:hypothetical protein